MNVVVFDLETTGLSPERDGIVEIGAVRIVDGRVDESQKFETLVRPTSESGSTLQIPWRAQQVHGISDAMVRHAPTIAQALPDFLKFVGNLPVVAHNAPFDNGFVRVAARRAGLVWAPPTEYCTVQLSRRAFPRERAHNLGVLAERLNLTFAEGGRHRSFGDVQVTAQAFVQLMERLKVASGGD